MRKLLNSILFTSTLLLMSISNIFAGGCTTPPAPVSASATVDSDTEVTITWTGGGGSTTHSVLYFCTSQWAGCNAAGSPDLVAISGSITITGLTAGTQYYWRIRGYNSGSGGCFSAAGDEINGDVTTTSGGGGGGGGGGTSCSDGIMNGDETGIDCGGSCPSTCATGDAPLCEPCASGSDAISDANAIDPTASGECVTSSIANVCTFSSSGVYGVACGAKSGGSFYATQYRTWYKVQVPATGIVGVTLQPLPGSERHLPKTNLYTDLVCGAGTAVSSYGYTSPDNCSFQNISNCGGGYTCGPNGTIALFTDIIGTTNALGSQSYWDGLTPGDYVWLCTDYLATVGGATSPYEATISACFFDSFDDNMSNNYIGGAPTPCGGAVAGTTRGSLQGLSLCDGFKPPNCGGGPAPSYENVSMFRMTADAAGTDITIDLTGATCTGSDAGLQFLVYTVGDGSGCTGTTPICGSGTCTLGSCMGGNTASGLADKTYTIAAPNPGEEFFILIDGFAGSICEFTITSTGCVILPISLVDFTIQKDGKNVNINWTTASELDNDYFTIERSFDGINFRTIANIDGQGTTSSSHEYEYVDQTLGLVGDVYYRLRQVDFNGNETFSIIQGINFSVKDGMEIKPNPTSNTTIIKFEASNSDYSAKLEVRDMNGKVVLNKDLTLNNGINTINLDMSKLNIGLYHIVIQKNSGILQNKVIKN